MVLGVHIRTRLKNDALIAETPAARRTLARVVLDRGLEFGLIAWAAPDTHLHLEALCDEAAASTFCWQVEVSLRKRLKLNVGFQMYPHIPIRRQGHLVNTFEYILRQRERHGVTHDPHREASSLPDLLRMRPRGRSLAALARRHLSRVTRQDLLQLLGVERLSPASGPVELLIRATEAAAALPNLRGSSREVVAARRALVEVAGAQHAPRELASLLRISPRTLRWLRARSVDPDLVHAIRLQLDLLRQLPDEFEAGF